MASTGKIQIKDKGEIPLKISINDSRRMRDGGEIDLTEVREDGQPKYLFALALDPVAVFDVSWELYADRFKAIGIPSKDDYELIFDEEFCAEMQEKMLEAIQGFFRFARMSLTMVRAYQSGSSSLEKAAQELQSHAA